MHETECIDIEPCDHCFTLPCVCTFVNINIYGDKGEIFNYYIFIKYSIWVFEGLYVVKYSPGYNCKEININMFTCIHIKLSG